MAIPIKCFVSHRPPSRDGGSVGRAKNNNNNNEHMIAYKISRLVCKIKYDGKRCILTGLSSIDVKTIGANKTRSCACKLKYFLLYK